jgi:hypothetical protein
LNRPAQDRKIFAEVINLLGQMKISEETSGRIVHEIGKFFLGAPYRAGLLETKGPEHLVVNLREFDCVTFVENVVALALCLTTGRKSFEPFRRLLQKIRYRQGRLHGYPSRLHYFSDWIHDNQKKGIVREVTPEIGGRPCNKILAFMTTHPDLYPPLQNAANLQRMKAIERAISRRSLSLISKKALSRLEGRIHEGDLIAIASNTKGLDFQHVGFAARVRNRVHLLHASSQEGRVVVSEQTLYRFLMKNRACSGIMVGRVWQRAWGRREKTPKNQRTA